MQNHKKTSAIMLLGSAFLISCMGKEGGHKSVQTNPSPGLPTATTEQGAPEGHPGIMKVARTISSHPTEQNRWLASGSKAQTETFQDNSMVKKAETKVEEKMGGNPQNVTPVDQSNNQQDLDLLGRIRKTLTRDDQLSLKAKNVQVITRDGKVYLEGEIESQQEKQQLESKVKAVQGVKDIVNKLTVENA